MEKTPLVGQTQQERFRGDRKEYTDCEGKPGKKGNQSCARGRLREGLGRGTGQGSSLIKSFRLRVWAEEAAKSSRCCALMFCLY